MGLGDEAVDSERRAGREFDQFVDEGPAVSREQGVAEFAVAGGAEALAVAVVQPKGDVGMTKSGAGDGGDDVAEFGALGLEELKASRDGPEEPADGGAGAARAADGAFLDQALVARQELSAGLAVAGDGAQPKFRDGGDAGQGLAAESQGLDACEVVDGGQLAGAVAFHRHRHFSGRDAAAVVSDVDQRLAALLHRHVDATGAGVQRVVQQFAHHRGWALDHLARGDLAADLRRQAPDAHLRRARCKLVQRRQGVQRRELLQVKGAEVVQNGMLRPEVGS